MRFGSRSVFIREPLTPPTLCKTLLVRSRGRACMRIFRVSITGPPATHTFFIQYHGSASSLEAQGAGPRHNVPLSFLFVASTGGAQRMRVFFLCLVTDILNVEWVEVDARLAQDWIRQGRTWGLSVSCFPVPINTWP